MSIISIRTEMQPGDNSFAMPVAFDFTSDVGPGQQVVAYAVAMSGFVLNYQTDSVFFAEDAGMVAVSLVPNLVGNVLHVDGNVVLTDFNGDTARAPGGEPTNPASGACITAIAVIDSSASSFLLGNSFGLPSGKDTSPIGVGANVSNLPFLAGFSFQATDNAGPVGGLRITTAVNGPVQQQVMLTGSASMARLPTTSAVDVGLLSIPAGSGQNFGIQLVNINTWQGPDGQNGITGEINVPFDVPAGQRIKRAALLLQNVNIVYDGTAAFQLISAKGNLDINDSGVTGTFTMNIYNPDALAHHYISAKSTVALYVIAQFST